MLDSKPKSLPPYRLLEAVRGLASVWVVLFHATLLVKVLDPRIADGSITGFILPALLKGFLGVQTFFVVSGYCIAAAACSVLSKPKPLATFSYHRVRRIFPPCWASLIFFGLAAAFATWMHDGQAGSSKLVDLDLAHQSFAFYFANLTLTQIIFHQPFISDVCWTLCYELAFYFLVAIALAAALALPTRAATVRPRFLLNLLHLLTLVCLILLYIMPEKVIYPFELWPQFGLGIAIYDALRSPRAASAWAAVVMSFGLMAGFIFLDGSAHVGFSQEAVVWTFSTALISAAILLALHRFDALLIRFARPAAFVGQFSYSLYLINFLAVNALVRIMHSLDTHGLNLSATGHFLSIFVITTLVLVPAYIFYYLFERPFTGAKQKAIHAAATRASSSTDASAPQVPESSPPHRASTVSAGANSSITAPAPRAATLSTLDNPST